jgi:hypothetical protein
VLNQNNESQKDIIIDLLVGFSFLNQDAGAGHYRNFFFFLKAEI